MVNVILFSIFRTCRKDQTKSDDDERDSKRIEIKYQCEILYYTISFHKDDVHSYGDAASKYIHNLLYFVVALINSVQP